MKRIVILAAIVVLLAATVSAQNRGWGNSWGNAQSLTVNGTLQLQNGVLAVADGTTVYFIPALERYIGFIEGLKEGARVSVEGYASGNYLQPAKVTINGKSYDFLATGNGPDWGRGGMMRGGFGPGRGGGYCGGPGWCWS